MPPLPPLTDWDATRDSLHRAAQVIGLIRKARTPRQRNALHLALFVTSHGLTTGPLADRSQVDLRFAEGVLRGHRPDGSIFTLALAGRAAGELLATLGGEMGLSASSLGPLETPDAGFEVDPNLGRDYALVLNTVFVGLAQWRARLLGAMTPLVVWPHGFDLSGLWFPGEDADEQTQPHINLGFSPGSAGLPRPYVYAYVWPWPEGVEAHPLPAPARWHLGEWKGAVLDYDALRRETDPPRAVAEAAETFFAVFTGN